MMTTTEVLGVVDRVLKERLSKDGYMEPSVSIGPDFDGEEVIRVTAHFAQRLKNSDDLYDCVTAIRDELSKSGDDRFVFLRQDFPGADGLDDDDKDSSHGTH